ncbi:amino acid ABC transporter ATP-binding protein [Burkholderia stagnalis]
MSDLSIQPAIVFAGVSKQFGAHRVLSDVTFSVPAGQVVVVCGSSGSGKSTLLRCVNGLEPVQSGSIHVDSIDVTDRRTNLQKLRAGIGFVFQSFNLYPHLTALQNVALAPVLVGGVERRTALERALALLERIGLADKGSQYPAQLSGGQQQRIAIARALAMQPKVMLFDEPTSALDPEMIREVLSLVSELASDDITMLIVTHELGFARRVADRILFMDAGRLVEDAPPDAFFDRPRHDRVKRFLDHVLHH